MPFGNDPERQRQDNLLGWIHAKLGGADLEPAPPVNSPNNLADYIHGQLHPSPEPAAQPTRAAAPVPEPGEPTEAEAQAWSIMSERQRAAVYAGEVDAVEDYRKLTAVYAGEP